MILSQRARDQFVAHSKVGEMFSLGRIFREQGKNPIDLMLGNPVDKPGPQFYTALREAVGELEAENSDNPHKYMDNVGYPETRRFIANYMMRRTGVTLGEDDVLMTVGTANGLNISFTTLTEPDAGHEVLVFTPGFMEYKAYAAQNGAIPVLVPLNDRFKVDYPALDAAINPKTKVLLMNFPNNPSGQVLVDDELAELATYLTRKNEEIGHEIVVLEDAPYDQVTFGPIPSLLFSFYPHTIYLASFSKTHSLAGERIGFMAVNPHIGDPSERVALRTTLANNLRYSVINAPALMQRLIPKIGCESSVNVAALENRVRILEGVLQEQGFHLYPSSGGFFIFAKIPDAYPDLQTWINISLEGNEPLLVVPGPFLGGEIYNRYIRLSATVHDWEIERAVRRLKEIHQTWLDREKRDQVTTLIP